MNVENLAELGIGEQFLNTWKSRGMEKLTQVQQMALSNAALLGGKNVVIVAPTSSGKTFVGEVLSIRVASSLHRAIYLVPYKALADEKYADFLETYRDLGVSVVVSSGDHSEFDQDIRRGDFGIAIIVYEKLAQLLVQSPGIISDCQLIVVDEAQLLREKERGPLLELLVTRIKRLRPSPQIVCLSATVGDLNGFDSWIGAEVIEVSERPVPLWEGVIERPGTVTLYNVAENRSESREFASGNPTSGKESTLEAVVKSLGPNQQMLIFRTQVDATEKTAANLAQLLPVRTLASEVRQRIMLLEDSTFRAFLDKNIQRGIAFHNAGLSLEERRLVEALLREGVLRVIVTTTTLAAGVNLPADMVAIFDYKRWDPSRRTQVAIDVGEYKNCAGRAGRYGKREAGIALLFAERPGETKILEQNYIKGSFPKLESAIPFYPELARHVLGIIAGQLADNRSDIVTLFRESFAFFSHYKPQGQENELIRAIESSINQLLTFKLVEEKDGKLGDTPLGRVAARSGVSIKTFGVLKDLVSSGRLETLSDKELLLTITDVEEMRRLRPFSSMDRAELLSRWIAGEEVRALSEDYSDQYSVGYGRIRELGEVAEWLLSVAVQIAKTINAPEPVIKKLTRLAQESHFGVPEELFELARLRALHRSDLLRLVKNDKGIKFTEPHKILDADPQQFVDILPPQKVTALKEKIASSIGETLRRRKVGHLMRCDKLAAIRPLVERVYDVHDSDFERTLEELLNAPLIELGVHRFARQKRGEPDLELVAPKGTIVISATASQDGRKPVSWDKAREVLGSVGFTGTASNFLVVGRPDFHKIAIDNAKEVVAKGTSLLLLPLDVLVEFCLRKVEGKTSREELIAILESTHGYLARDQVESPP